MPKYDTDYGSHRGKFDIERTGIFGELGYMNGEGYVSPFATDKNDPRTKGAQMLSEGPKIRTALQDCYFDKEYRRLYEGEAWKDPTTIARKARLANLQKRFANVDFIPPSAPKKHSGSGDYCGTFGGIVEEFSPVQRRQPKYVKPPPNLYTSPGKKGGPTYPNICFSKYPQHSVESYGGDRIKLKLLRLEAPRLAGPFLGQSYPTYFNTNPYRAIMPDESHVKPEKKPGTMIGTAVWMPTHPAKKDGGCKDGALNKWPEHKPDRAKVKKEKKWETKVFYPQARNKTMYTTSISHRKIDTSCNSTNWRVYNQVSFPHIT